MAQDETRSWIQSQVDQIQDFSYLAQDSAAHTTGHSLSTLSLVEHRLLEGIRLYRQRDFCAAAMALTGATEERGPHVDVALFYLGLTLRVLGRHDLACNSFQNAYRLSGRLTVAIMEAGRSALHLNRSDVAVGLFKVMLQQSGERPQYYSALSLEELAYYEQAKAHFAPRVENFLQPCPLLGIKERKITSLQDAIVGTLFDRTLEAWERGELRPPPLAGRWKVRPRPNRPLRVMYVFSQHINCSETHAKNEMTFHLMNTSNTRGYENRLFRADKILYGLDVVSQPRLFDGEFYIPSAPGTAAELQRLDQELQEFRPDWVFFEANFIPTETTISPAELLRLKQKHKFRLISVVPDMYDNAPDFTSRWIDTSDLVLSFHDRSERFDRFEKTGKMFYYPSLPFQGSGEGRPVKTLDFAFVGSLTRDRAAFLSALPGHISNYRVLGSGRALQNPNTPPDWNLYHRLLSQARATFNSGFIGHLTHPYIQTGRSVESILAHTALFEEGRRALEGGYVPYVHYVPVLNVNQFVIQLQFLLSHPEHRVAMTDRAFSWFQEHFGPEQFWSELETRLPV